MEVLVTGGYGRIGQMIIPRLQNMGMAIKIYDLLDGNDIHDTQKLREWVRDMDACIHLAGIPDPQPHLPMSEFYKQNVMGTESVIEACDREGVYRIVYASSGAIYGFSNGQFTLKQLPLTENQGVGDAPDNYDLSKLWSEEHLWAWTQKARVQDATAICLRLDTPVPPCVVVPHHLNAQISPHNLAEGFRAALESCYTGFLACNIGDPKFVGNSIEFAKTHFPDVVSRLVGPDEPCYSIDLAIRTIGYNPE